MFHVVYYSMTLISVSAVQRSILFDLKDEIVPPTNETVTQVFARLSAYRDSMDGPQVSAGTGHAFFHAMYIPLQVPGMQRVAHTYVDKLKTVPQQHNRVHAAWSDMRCFEQQFAVVGCSHHMSWSAVAVMWLQCKYSHAWYVPLVM